jgi:polygalacturonase
MEVNDDSVVLKGGKGPWADEQAENGANERILVEDCTYGFCHSGLTCGSESVHNRNVLVRRIRVNNIMQLLHLKLRPDTPQHYEYITIEDVEGTIEGNFINVNPWTQFFDLKGRTDKPISKVEKVTIRNCKCTCDTFFNVYKDEKQYTMSAFTLQNLQICAREQGNTFDVIDGIKVENVSVKLV